MRTWLAAALVVTALPLTAGCLGGTGELRPDCQTLDLTTFTASAGPGAPAHRAPGEPVPVMVWAENVAAVALSVQATLAPEGEVVASSLPMDDDPLDGGRLAPGERWFLALALTPTQPGGNVTIELRTDGVGLEADARELGCDHDVTHTRTLETQDPQPAPEAEGGKGVLVRTVGWWTNGTSFYTNHERYHARPDLPGGYLSPYNGSEPLKVYVYNRSGDEMPERYNESGYVTTIPGFNEALKGLPTTGARVAHLEPDEAYTRDGYEDHPLYGDPLVFYIEAIEVETVPCEVPQPVCTLPGTDDVPAPPDPTRPPVSLNR